MHFRRAKRQNNHREACGSSTKRQALFMGVFIMYAANIEYFIKICYSIIQCTDEREASGNENGSEGKSVKLRGMK